MKKLFIDIESLGLDNSCGLIQLAGIIEIDGKIAEKFNFSVQPFEADDFEDKALEMHGVSEDELDKFFEAPYEPPVEVYAKMEKIFKKYINPYKKNKDNPNDKFWFIGYNCNQFDYPFFRYWAEKKLEQKYFGAWFWYPPIDVMALAGDVLIHHRPKMENFKLMTVAKFVGINTDESQAHDALYDIEITRKLYNKISVWNLKK